LPLSKRPRELTSLLPIADKGLGNTGGENRRKPAAGKGGSWHNATRKLWGGQAGPGGKTASTMKGTRKKPDIDIMNVRRRLRALKGDALPAKGPKRNTKPADEGPTKKQTPTRQPIVRGQSQDRTDPFEPLRQKAQPLERKKTRSCRIKKRQRSHGAPGGGGYPKDTRTTWTHLARGNDE